MMVVKLGGSLNRDPCLPDWLQLLADRGGGRVVIVPGGGPFVDQVREHQEQWRFDDLTAHNKAILGMMQSAMLMRGISPQLRLADSPAAIGEVLRDGKVALWSPSSWIRAQADDMTHWGATSDSLAAWLAASLQATRLVLIKSCRIQENVDLAGQIERGVLDVEFGRVAADARYSIELLEKTALPRMRALLD
jgi:aspartokinase-like uncharacterized kinase